MQQEVPCRNCQLCKMSSELTCRAESGASSNTRLSCFLTPGPWLTTPSQHWSFVTSTSRASQMRSMSHDQSLYLYFKWGGISMKSDPGNSTHQQVFPGRQYGVLKRPLLLLQFCLRPCPICHLLKWVLNQRAQSELSQEQATVQSIILLDTDSHWTFPEFYINSQSIPGEMG